MSTPINDGGSAFAHAPFVTNLDHHSAGSKGMSLRAWLSGKALIALSDRDYGDDPLFRTLAEDAVALADAVIKALEANP